MDVFLVLKAGLMSNGGWNRSLRTRRNVRFAGQITGVEGYVESTAIGLLAGRFAAAELMQTRLASPPPTTAFGALLAHITLNAEAGTFQPMNMNFGLMPVPEAEEEAPRDAEGRKLRGKARMHARKTNRQRAYTSRARTDFAPWLAQSGIQRAAE